MLILIFIKEGIWQGQSLENMPAAQLMKIKQATFNALKIIRTIHLNDGKVMTSTSIAEKEKISPGVVIKVLRKLRDAGVLCVIREEGRFVEVLVNSDDRRNHVAGYC